MWRSWFQFRLYFKEILSELVSLWSTFKSDRWPAKQKSKRKLEFNNRNFRKRSGIIQKTIISHIRRSIKSSDCQDKQSIYCSLIQKYWNRKTAQQISIINRKDWFRRIQKWLERKTQWPHFIIRKKLGKEYNSWRIFSSPEWKICLYHRQQQDPLWQQL